VRRDENGGASAVLGGFEHLHKHSKCPLSRNREGYSRDQREISCTEADVFAFGSVLLQLMSRGVLSASTLSRMQKRSLRFTRKKNLLLRSHVLRSLVRECWSVDVLLRPSMSQISESLSQFTNHSALL
jgi:hypothetical protein